jgi:cytochrome c peroxidase
MRHPVLLCFAGVLAICGAGLVLRADREGKSLPNNTLPESARAEIAAVEAEINGIEAETLAKAQQGSLDASQQVLLLGKLLFYDRQLSVQRNEACAFCHMPEAEFTGPVSALNQTTVAYPGSVRTHFNGRIPQTHAYASFSPVLHYNAPQGDLVGGAFWDMRATGLRLNSPLAEQAQGPPLDPNEMGLIEPACVVYRISSEPYRAVAEHLWGVQAFAIRWPADVGTIWDRPGPASEGNPRPVRLRAVDRGIALTTYDQIAGAIAANEGSPEVNSFSSKYDLVTAGKAQFTPEENAGYALFRSKATHCNECHRDGGPGEEPLFTDFTASNLGLPQNRSIPFYHEDVPDGFGYTANKLGTAFVDNGVGGFLQGPGNPDEQWTQ